MSMTSGFLLVRKPSGMTSHDVVAAVRRRLRATRNKEPKTRNTTNRYRAQSPAFKVPKVGHAGTLDPLATGLLIIGVGTATKKLGSFLKLPKTYEAEVTLDARSTTDDAEGVIRQVPSSEYQVPRRETVERVLRRFTGELEQTPPAYSAVKIRGVPAHRRVRRGETVTLTPRRVTIENITLLSYEYPRLHIRCTVSSGTYIRALARDIGTALGTGGYLASLTRTRIGPYRIEDATDVSELTAALVLPSLLRDPKTR